MNRSYAKLSFLMLATAFLAGFPYVSQAIVEPSAEPNAELAPQPKPTVVPPSPSAGGDTTSRDFTVIRMGKEEIKNSEAVDLWKSLFPGGTAPDFNTFDEAVRQNVLRGIVSERLIYQQALVEGYDKSEEVQKRLESLKKQLIMQTFMENKAKTLVTEQELKDAYAKRAAELQKQKEVKASHILVNTEEEAKKVIEELDGGKKFEDLAKSVSEDKASGSQGGDLGYFTQDRMVPEFSEAAFALSKGEVSDPVKTSFGWHIIRVDDKRPVTVPSYEELHEELLAEISNRAVQTYVESLLENADIRYYGSDGKQRDFSRSLEPAN